MSDNLHRQLRTDSGSADSGLLTASAVLPVDPSDTCLWADGHDCRTPRSCFDCLNTAPAKGQCMVDPVGRCVRIDGANTSGHAYVSSTNTSYCDASDTQCAACRDSSNQTDGTGWYATGSTQRKPLCVGAKGCVCIAVCETPTWRVNVLAICSSQLQEKQAQQTSVYVTVMTIASVLCVVMFCLSGRWIKRPHRSMDFDGEPETPVPRRPTTRPQLELTAWHSMRQKLMDEEAGRQAARTITTADRLHRQEHEVLT